MIILNSLAKYSWWNFSSSYGIQSTSFSILLCDLSALDKLLLVNVMGHTNMLSGMSS